MPSRRNEYIVLYEQTNSLISHVKFTRLQLRHKARINRKFIDQLMKMEDILHVLKEHILDLPDGLESNLEFK